MNARIESEPRPRDNRYMPTDRQAFVRGDCFRLIGSRRYRSPRYLAPLSEKQIRRKRFLDEHLYIFCIFCTRISLSDIIYHNHYVWDNSR